MRARLQGPPRLRLGVDRDILAAALGADPPQPDRPRTWHSFHRHTVLSMCAQALLAVAAARPAPPGAGPPPASPAGQPAAWRDTGKLPATAGGQPPGDDPGLVKVSVPEARRLARLATAPISRATRDLGYAWSRWRRRHQARARWHHYQAQLKAAQVT